MNGAEPREDRAADTPEEHVADLDWSLVEAIAGAQYRGLLEQCGARNCSLVLAAASLLLAAVVQELVAVNENSEAATIVDFVNATFAEAGLRWRLTALN